MASEQPMRDGGQTQTVFIKLRWIVTKRDVAVDFEGKKCGFQRMDVREGRAGRGCGTQFAE
jgi:hypothetical protein